MNKITLLTMGLCGIALVIITGEVLQNQPELIVDEPVIPKSSKLESYHLEYAKELEVVSDDARFMGGDYDEAVVQPPATIETVLDGFAIKVPDLSEDHLEAEVYKEQLQYTLGNLQSDILDGVLQEYQSHYGTLLSEMGLSQSCDGSYCGYQIGQGAFFDVLKANDFERGDVILAINSQNVNTIDRYDVFKATIFNQADQIELSISRKGEIKYLQIPIIQSNL
jgi:type II secretory pathway component PulC